MVASELDSDERALQSETNGGGKNARGVMGREERRLPLKGVSGLMGLAGESETAVTKEGSEKRESVDSVEGREGKNRLGTSSAMMRPS